ncbi:MAG TPA: alpha/beta fold hydrolase [Lysobacter sp.]
MDRRTFNTALIAGAAAAATGPSFGKETSAPGEVRNVVLVHGLFADGSSWLEVIPHLQAAGLNVTSVQNPLTTLEEAVASCRRVLDRQDGPTALAGHSFSGMIVTEAGAHPNVSSLVYVAARAPDAGEDYAALAIDEAAGLLYVNNAGDGRVLRMPLAGGKLDVLADGVYGADGLLLHDGLLWVASNQIDAVVALDANGLVWARAGHFDGIGNDGAPLGLLFPAATAVQGKRMLVANLALPLTPREGDEWEEKVTRWNLVQFDIPEVDPR